MLITKELAMPNKNTFEIKPIYKFIKNEVQEGVWLDPFANNKKIATITNDLNPNFKTDYNLDALEFLKSFDNNSVDGVLFDPPYSPRQIKESYESVGLEIKGKEITQSSFWAKLKDEVQRVLKINGKVICFGWNSNGCGVNRGFEMTRILLVAHGGNHNDTLVTVEKKTKEQIKLF